jgi:hypothetical protein
MFLMDFDPEFGTGLGYNTTKDPVIFKNEDAC